MKPMGLLVSTSTRSHLTNMREIDLNDMTIVQAGLAWPHAQNPTSREMLPLLERKEQYVSWLQPNAGGVDDQLPSMQINGRFFALSLRLQKVLFRHVRLQHDFVNRERTADGQLKLRIPVALYQDKKKTALRFMVQPHSALAKQHGVILLRSALPEPARKSIGVCNARV
jgi:hypothetical protein